MCNYSGTQIIPLEMDGAVLNSDGVSYVGKEKIQCINLASSYFVHLRCSWTDVMRKSIFICGKRVLYREPCGRI